MKRHINDLHCQQCENKFSGDAHLKDHIEVDQEKDINDESILKPFPYNCEMCENGVTFKGILKISIYHHMSAYNVNTFPCVKKTWMIIF